MFDWQTLISLALVGSAAVYVLRRFQVTLQGGKSGCGSCSSCPSNASSTMQNSSATGKQISLVQISAPTKAE